MLRDEITSPDVLVMVNILPMYESSPKNLTLILLFSAVKVNRLFGTISPSIVNVQLPIA